MKRALFGALAVLVTRPALAQEAPKDEPKEKDLEVRVIGNKADSLQRVPGSGTVITQKELTRQAPVDTAEVLRRVPGVQVRQEFSGGSRIDISIRGLDAGRSRRVLMLEDGIPMALNPYTEPDLNHAPTIERYRSIEVVKGSGNILFGPQTLAGTINFITVTPPDRQTVVTDVDFGSYGYSRALASYGDTVGDVRYIVQLTRRAGDGFRAQPFDSINGLGKILFPTGKDGEAVLKLGFQRDDAASDDVGITREMYRANPRRPTVSPHAQTILYRYDASLTHEQRLGERTKLKTLVYGYVTDRDWRRPDWTRNPVAGERYLRIVGDASVPGGALFFSNGNTILSRNYEVFGFEPRFEHRLKTGFVEHTFDFGGRVLHEQAHYQQRTGAYAETWAGSLDFEQTRRSWAGAAYAQDRIAFREDLLVTPGIRLEHVDPTTYTQRQNGIDQYTTSGQSTTGVIPGVGMVFGTKRVSVFGNMHYGFAPPRVTTTICPRGEVATLQGDRGISYELGTRGQQFKWLRGEATGFVSNYSNQVSVNPNAAGEVALADVGATNIYGVESAVVVSIDKIIKVPTVLDLAARYTYAHATFRHGAFGGNFLPYAPKHSLNTNFDVELKNGLGGQIAYSYVSNQFADGDNTRAEDPFGIVGLIEARHIFDATAHYRHRPSGFTFRLSVKNVFDETYIIGRRPEGIFPGPYRQILAGIRGEWDRAKSD